MEGTVKLVVMLALLCGCGHPEPRPQGSKLAEWREQEARFYAKQAERQACARQGHQKPAGWKTEYPED